MNQTNARILAGLFAGGFASALALGSGTLTAARAETMSAQAFLKTVNANADKTISMEELDTFAKKRFSEMEKDGDKTLDQKELKGRLSEAGMAMADTDKDKSVDEAEFVGYADKLFAEANVHKKPAEKDHPTLSKKELETPAGQKLMMLLR